MEIIAGILCVAGVTVTFITHHALAVDHGKKQGERIGLTKARRWCWRDPAGFMAWASHMERQGK